MKCAEACGQVSDRGNADTDVIRPQALTIVMAIGFQQFLYGKMFTAHSDFPFGVWQGL
jgi:hypothetical protein